MLLKDFCEKLKGTSPPDPLSLLRRGGGTGLESPVLTFGLDIIRWINPTGMEFLNEL